MRDSAQPRLIGGSRISSRPKRLLLGFEAEGPDKAPAHVLLREVIARLQAQRVDQLWGAAGLDRAGLPLHLLEAIGLFTPGPFEEVEANYPDSTVEVLEAYLEESLGPQIAPAEQVARWLEELSEVRALLRSDVVLGDAVLSPAENPLLAMPYLPRGRRPCNPDSITRLVREYVAAVERLASHAPGLLAVIADYGRRWDVVLETVVPLHGPFTVKLREDRPIQVDSDGALQHQLGLGEARSFHLEVRVADPSFEVRGEPRVATPDGEPIGIPLLEGVRFTSELFAAYSSEPGRPDVGEVVVPLAPVKALRWTTRGVEFLAWGALVATVIAAITGGDDIVERLGVVAIPTTFAVALLVVREQTPLAERLMAGPKVRALVATALLWAALIPRAVLEAIH